MERGFKIGNKNAEKPSKYATLGKWEACWLQISYDCVRFTEVAPNLDIIFIKW